MNIKSILLATSFATTVAHAGIVSVTGSGGLSSVGQSITGDFVFDSGTVGYTLTLDAISGPPSLQWNGHGDAEGSPNPGFAFDVDTPDLTDAWSVTFAFSEPVKLDWSQRVNLTSIQNQGASRFSFDYVDNSATPSLVDPDSQIFEEFTGSGFASFRIETNPGVGSTGAGGTVNSGDATWGVIGVASTELVVSWTAASDAFFVNKEVITINGGTSGIGTLSAVPEPSEVASVGLVALAGLLSFRRFCVRKKG